MAWKIGLVALACIAVAIASVSRGRCTSCEKRALSRVACYIALANDLTPLVKVGTADLTASSRDCVEAART